VSLDQRTEFDAAFTAGLLSADPGDLEPGSLKSITLPEGATHEVLDLEAYGRAPRRLSFHYKVRDAESFGRLWHRFAHADSVLFADAPSVSLVAVIDEATADGASWREQAIIQLFTCTPAWQRWLGLDNKLLSQTQFAEHVEDSLADIVDPDAATMLEIAQTFHAHRTAQFAQSTRLNSGQRQFTYNEEITAGAGQRGDLVVPETLTLGLTPFEGGARYSVTARLRFRLLDGALTLGFKLDRPDDVERAAFEEAVHQVEVETGTSAIHGLAG
jgi:uncharacterized protein YfdQ (DUF2303 family)